MFLLVFEHEDDELIVEFRCIDGVDEVCGVDDTCGVDETCGLKCLHG
jgi:hypothetical protein